MSVDPIPVTLPAGSKMLLGAPAEGPSMEDLEALCLSLKDLTAATEAHLPLVYWKGLGDAPQLMLAVVPAEGADLAGLQRSVTARLDDCRWASDGLRTFVVTDPGIVETLRGAAVQVWPILSAEWSAKVGKRNGEYRHVSIAIIVSLLLLAAWTLLFS